jgi:L-ascorbate metabolism protein UlaG (beta-lactamase superfamily)
MGKVLKMILYVMAALLLLLGLAGIYVWNNFGANPSAKEEEAYARLSYYKDGRFQSPKKLYYDFDNVRNGPAGWARFLKASPFAPQGRLPMIMLNKDSFPKTPDDFAVYWLGHSGAIMELDGKRIVFDPVLGNATPLPFGVPRYDVPPIKRKHLPDFDYIVITHNHYDHLEKKTVQAIKNGHFIVPLGVKAALKGWGIPENRITELGWGDVFERGGLKIIAHEGIHYSGRTPWNRYRTLWNSYVILSENKKIFWGGDIGYGEEFERAGKTYGPFDFAALEIDGWNPGWPNTHLFPHEVIQAAKDLHTKNVLAIHWGVFDLALHPWHESIDMVLDEAEGSGIKILTPKMGERINLNSETTPWWRGLDF